MVTENQEDVRAEPEKTARPIKAEKPKKPVKPAAAAEKSAGKKKSGGKAIAISVICLMAAGIALVLFLTVSQNLFGGRDAVIARLGAMDPEYRSLQERQEDLDKREADITKREAAAEKKEASLSEEKKKLEEQSETANDSSFETYMAGLSEGRLAQLEQVAEIYSGMDPEKAAEVLAQLGSTEDMAVVIYCMEPEAAAEIMDCLDGETATAITENMLS